MLFAKFRMQVCMQRCLNTWLLNEYGLDNDWHLAGLALVQYGVYRAANLYRNSHLPTQEEAYDCVCQFVQQAAVAHQYSAKVQGICWNKRPLHIA